MGAQGASPAFRGGPGRYPGFPKTHNDLPRTPQDSPNPRKGPEGPPLTSVERPVSLVRRELPLPALLSLYSLLRKSLRGQAVWTDLQYSVVYCYYVMVFLYR